MVRASDRVGDRGVSRSLVSKVLSGRVGQSTVRPECICRLRAGINCGVQRHFRSLGAFLIFINTSTRS